MTKRIQRERTHFPTKKAAPEPTKVKGTSRISRKVFPDWLMNLEKNLEIAEYR